MVQYALFPGSRMSAKLDNRKRRGIKMKPLSRMTAEELKEIVEDAVERKLYEIIEDPDKGLNLKPQVRKRLKSTLNRLLKNSY